MAQIQRFLNSIKVFDNTSSPCAAGAGDQESTSLSAQSAKSRPNGKFRYVYGILFIVSGACTHAGQGSVALPAIKLWQLLSRIYLRVQGIMQPIVRDMSSLDIIRMAQQVIKVTNPDQISKYLPVADIASSESGNTQTVKYFLPLAPFFARENGDPQKYVGCLPLSSFADAEFKFAPRSSSTLYTSGGDSWTIGNITIEVRLLTTDLNHAVPVVPVFWRGETLTGSAVEAPKADGIDARIIGLAATKVDDSAFATGATFSLAFGSDVVIENRLDTNLIDEGELFTHDGFSDSPFTTIIPICEPNASGLDELPVAQGKITVYEPFSQNSNTGRLIVCYAEELTEAAQIQIQVQHRQALADVTPAVQSLTAARTADNFALVERTIASSR